MMRDTKYLAAVVAPGAVVALALVFVVCFAPAAAEPAPAETEASAQTLLFVRTTPAGAEVRLDGKRLGKSDRLFKVDPGDYKIVVDLAGHQPREEKITVTQGRITRIELTLTKQPGGAASASAVQLPNDALLNEAQRLFRDWTESYFKGMLDPTPWQNLSRREKAAKEKEWIEQLSARSASARISAINGLAAIGSKKAVPGLLKIAAERVEKDNRDRWMAVRALGLVGDEKAVPELVHLTYHYNSNTRFWARISLVRLTGQNFGRDVAAWARWWKAQGKKPPISTKTVAWATSPEALPYADPQKQEESDRQFVERYKAQKQAAVQLPEDAQLNEAQRLYRDWSDTYFKQLVDASPWQGLSEREKAAKAKAWIKQLDTLKGRDRIPAINGLAALRRKEAAPALLKIAAERVERDNRDRWMATRALGLVGDKSVVPELVHLTYHYNSNTRRWAQISLVRLTGQNFGRDLDAWKRWWQEQGGKPPISDETIQWTKRADWADPEKQEESDRQFFEMMKERSETSAVGQGGAPQIVSMNPPNGAKDVDPKLSEIRVTFSVPMGGGFSWTGGGAQFPKVAEGKRPSWSEDRKTCVLPVELKPGWEYRLGLNSPSHKNFRSAGGVPLEPVVYRFSTRAE